MTNDRLHDQPKDRKVTPSELGLPFQYWYPHQFESAQAIAESDKKFTLLESPCGGGKSGLAIAAARMMNVPRTVILCSTKQLQLQYQEAFSDVAIMWGRSNFRCALDPDFTCDAAPCHLEMGCSEQEKWHVCEYYAAKRNAMKAPICISNSAFFLLEANHVGGFSGLDFLVVDEGDLLERELLRFSQIELSRRSLAHAEVDLPDLSSVYEARRWAEKHLPTVERLAIEAEAKAKEDMSFLKGALRLRGHKKRLQALSTIDPQNWVIERTLFGYAIQPLWAADFGQRYVFRHANRVLIMSATMPPPEVYARQLGITEEVQYIETPSFFPKENRPVNYWPITKLKGNAMASYQLNQIANAIDMVLEKFPDSKGIVHTVSYRLRDAILSRTRYPRRFISHNLDDSWSKPESRSDALDKFLQSTEANVLISPSMGRGVDLAGDFGRWCIIVKLPFLSLGNPQVKARMEKDRDWYIATCADELVQSSGRIVRSMEDWGVTFILDENFSWFAKRNKAFFPSWWRESLHKIDSLEQAVLPPQM